MHGNFLFSCMETSYFHACKFHIFIHENEIFMHENEMFINKKNENFARGMIFSPQRFSWVVELYTTSCMEFSPMEILGQDFHYHA